MIRLLALAAAALSLAFAAPGDARAQDAAAATPAFIGLTPESVRDWLVAAGAQAGEVTREGDDVFFRVDNAGVVWFLFFYACEADGRCGDMQFSSVFDGRGITPDIVNAWNRERRYLKAFIAEADGTPVVFLQFDLLFVSGQPAAHLADPTVVWLEGVAQFGQFVSGRQAAPATPAAGQ